jgi:uncharacterized membrane protein YeiH
MDDLTVAFIAQITALGGGAQALLGGVFTGTNPTDAQVIIPSALELVAVIAGAVAGALTACNRRLDIVGVCMLALISSLGGGLLRDMILSTGSVYMLDHPGAVICCLATGLVAFFFSGLLYRLNKPIAVFDILSVALFTYTGADKALVAGYGFVACVMMGVLTGVGGGFCRDICLGRIPNIFRSSNYYAVCSLAGAVVYLLLAENHVNKELAGIACACVVVLLRWVSLRYNLMTAVPRDLTPHVMGPLRRLRNHVATQHEEEDRASGGTPGDVASNEDPRQEATAEKPGDAPGDRAGRR